MPTIDEEAEKAMSGTGRSAVVMTSHWGHVANERRRAEERDGRRPRRPPTEVAAALEADLIDAEWMATNAHPLARLVARRVSLPAGQVLEVVLRHRRYDHVCAWADRIGLPLAMAFKLLRARTDLVLVSVDLLAAKKALFLSRGRVHTHMRAIQSPSSVQIDRSVVELGVPRDVFVFDAKAVDTAFWRARTLPSVHSKVCAVGWEARDYPTLLRALRGLDVEVHAAVGTVVLSSPDQARAAGQASAAPPPLELLRGTAGFDSYQQTMEGLSAAELSAVVWRTQLDAVALRELYERSRIVVVPLLDVPFDAGATALHEAMAMGRPVVVTRTQGQVDLVVDGETGIYVAPGDPMALRAALERLLGDPEECDRMGRAARRRAVEQFDFDRFVRRTAALVAGEYQA